MTTLVLLFYLLFATKGGWQLAFIIAFILDLILLFFEKRN